MATSASNPLQEHITCSVCLEIYNNPHILRCLHTYCYQCIQDVKEGYRVKCPDCRNYTIINNIQKDFKMQSLIDIHEKSKEQNPKIPTEILCDVCEESGKPIHSYCSNCEEHLCADCAKAHRGSRLTKSHKLIAFKELHKSKEDMVEEHITLLRNEQTAVDGKLTSNRELINNIRQAELRQVAEVNRCRKTVIQQVDGHHDGLIEELQTINKNVVETLEQQGQLLTQAKQQLQDKVNFLSDIFQSQDYSVLTDTLNNLCKQVQQAIKEIRTGLPKFDAKTKSPVTVANGDDWDPLKSTRLEITGAALGVREHAIPQTMIPHKNKAIHQRYGQIESLTIEYYPTKLCVDTDELWVGSKDKGVFVYDLDLQPIKHITHSQFKCLTSVFKTSTDIIVCDSETGLHCLNQQGDYLQCLYEGCFSDIGLYKNQLYVLNFKQHTVYTFRRTQNSWVKDTEFKVSHYNEGDESDKLCVTSTGIYLSCCNTNCVQCYSHTGQFVYQTGKWGKAKYGTGGVVGDFDGPLLSDVDSGGRRLLVCDWYNNRLQVLDTDTREWSEVTGLEGMGYPRCAGLGDKHLWVGNGWPHKLLKYEVKGE